MCRRSFGGKRGAVHRLAARFPAAFVQGAVGTTVEL
jgi:hypothetical protein